MLYPEHSLRGGLTHCKGAVSVFYSPHPPPTEQNKFRDYVLRMKIDNDAPKPGITLKHKPKTKTRSRPVGWGHKVHQLHLCRGVRPLPSNCPGYDTKLSDGDASVLKLWRMWSTPLFPLLQDPLLWRVVVSVKVSSMGQMELFNILLYLKPFNCVQIKLLVLNINTQNDLTVCK